MSVIEIQNGIKYMVMKEEHKLDALDLTSEIFGKYEPAGQMVGMTPKFIRSFMIVLFEYFVKSGLSIVAIDEETNKLVGVFTAWDQHKFEKEMGFFEGLSLAWHFFKTTKSNPGNCNLQPMG